MQPEQPRTFRQDLQATTNCLMFTIRMTTAPVESVLRRDFGNDYFGLPALFSLLAIPLFGTFFPDSSPMPLLALWWLYIAMLLVTRINGLRRWLRKEIEHTQYSGFPRLQRFFPRLSEIAVKANVEPLVVLVIGIIIAATFSPPLGGYLILAAIALGLNVRMGMMDERRRLLDLTDAAIEQGHLANQFRTIYR